MAKKNDILINVLLDRSGSMAGLITDVIGHYNTYIEDQKKQPGKATVSLVIFDNEYEEVYLGKDIQSVPILTKDTYNARGSTAYLDALGRLIKSVDGIKNKPAKVVILINTDGLENASREYTAKQIKELVTERTNNHDWQFVFVGAGIDALSVSRDLGIYNFIGAAASVQGNASTYGVFTNSLNNYRSGVSSTMDTGNVDFQVTPDAEIPPLKKKKVTTK